MKNDWQKHLNFGIEISIYVVFLFFCGYYADKYFKTAPLFTIAGIFIAVVGVFYTIWKKYLKIK